MVDFIGWVGGILLAGCAVPLTIEAMAEKSIHINYWFLLNWTLGEVLCLIYAAHYGKWPLVFNYVANLLLLMPVWWYRK